MNKSRSIKFVLAAAVLLYIIAFGGLSLASYDTYHTYTFDLGIINQVVWNTSQGRWFETSLGRQENAELVGSYMGNHVRPILLLLAPVYRLWSDPRLLLILQSVSLGLAAVPLYWIALKRGRRPATGLAIALCYLAYPALGFLNLFDFHPIVFSIPLLLLAYWALLERRMPLFWISILLALATKEEMVIPVGMWGLVSLLQRDRRRIGIGLVLLAGAWAVLCFGFIIPHYNDGQPYRFLRYWSQNTGAPVQETTSAERIVAGDDLINSFGFLLHLFLPLGFLPFMGPAALAVALPSLVYLLAGRVEYHSIGYQYPAVLIPWFFVATIEGLQRLPQLVHGKRGQTLSRIGLAFLVGGTLGTNYMLNPIAVHVHQGSFSPEPHHAELSYAMEQIPPQAGIATINGLGAPLSDRRILVALEFPPPLRLDHVTQAGYVLLDLVDCRAVATADPRADYATMVRQTLDTGVFRPLYHSGRILLLQRGEPSEEELAEVYSYIDGLVADNLPCWP